MNRRHFLRALVAVPAAISLAPKLATAATLEQATTSGRSWPGFSYQQLLDQKRVFDEQIARERWIQGVDIGLGPDRTILTMAQLSADQRTYYNARLLKRMQAHLPLDILGPATVEGRIPRPITIKYLASGDSTTFVSDGRRWIIA